MKLGKCLKKRNIIIGAVIIIVILLFVFAPRGKNGIAESGKIVVERSDLIQEVELSGTVEAIDDIALAAQSSGIVKSIAFKAGDSVKKGDKIVLLDNKDALVTLAKAKASVSAEEARLAELVRETGETDTSSDLEAVRAQQDILVANAYEALLNNDLQAYPYDEDDHDDLAGSPLVSGTYNCDEEGNYILTVYRSTSGTAFRFSGLEYGNQSASSDHYLSMGDCGLFIKFEEDFEDTGDWIIPIPNTRSSSYSTALGAYNSAIKNRDVYLSQATVKTEEILAQEASLASAKAQLQDAYNELADKVIKAPIDGIIAKINVDPGEYVSLGETVVQIISAQNLEILAYVPEIDLGKLTTGQRAEITLESYGSDELFYGNILTIAPSAELVDSVPSYEVKLAFDSEDERIKSGMTADITIQTGERKNVLSVPARAIIDENGGGKYVDVLLPDETTEKRSIETGMRSSDGAIEILSGLSEGETVVWNFK